MEKFINNAPFALVLVFLVIGFVLLIKGADFFVEGSSSVAKRLHVPSIIIGLTIVAMGTSLPETAVSVSASLTGNNELAVSNVVGSNIFNLMVVIGVCAMIATVNVAKETIKRDIPFSLICAGLLLFLGIAGFGDKAGMILGHLDGVIFLGAFAGYISYMIKVALEASKEGRKVEIEGASEEEIRLISVPLSILFIIGGAAAIAVGGDITVDAASRIASDLGMSQTLIGLTIVSIGTSLPELVTSIVAARKNEVDMALGNAIGSNVFNILMVLGIASAISPVSLITENIIDLWLVDQNVADRKCFRRIARSGHIVLGLRIGDNHAGNHTLLDLVGQTVDAAGGKAQQEERRALVRSHSPELHFVHIARQTDGGDDHLAIGVLFKQRIEILRLHDHVQRHRSVLLIVRQSNGVDDHILRTIPLFERIHEALDVVGGFEPRIGHKENLFAAVFLGQEFADFVTLRSVELQFVAQQRIIAAEHIHFTQKHDRADHHDDEQHERDRLHCRIGLLFFAADDHTDQRQYHQGTIHYCHFL